MDVLSDRLTQTYPQDYDNMGAVVVPIAGELIGMQQRLFFTLLGAVGLVLLIVCVNVANLLLARAAERAREFAVRTALGASRLRLISQLIIESMILALTAGALAFLFARLSLEPIMALVPPDSRIPRLDQVRFDWLVLAFTMAVSLLTAVMFGLAPALRAARTPPQGMLKETGRAGESRRARRWRDTLIVAEIALSLVLLAGAGLLVRSLWQLQQVDTGFESEGVLALRLTIPAHHYGVYETGGTNPDRARLYQIIEREIEQLPGVQSAALSAYLPFKHGPNPWGMTIVGRAAPAPTDPDGTARSGRPGLYYHGSISIERVTPDYFATLGIPLLRGRHLTDQDVAGRPLVTVISETLARKHFPGEDALGRRIIVDMTSYFPEMTIVGVAADTRMHGPVSDFYPLLFWSMAQLPSQNVWLIVKTRGGLSAAQRNVQAAIERIDADIAIEESTTMLLVIAESMWRERLTALLLSAFAAFAMLLVLAGVYAVTSYSITQRMREMSLRIALGARPSDITRLIVGHGVKLALAGAALGLASAFMLRGVLAAQLHNVSPTDPWTLVAACALLIGTATAAAYAPAHRALAADPIGPLRQE
jgi:predicted permease